MRWFQVYLLKPFTELKLISLRNWNNCKHVLEHNVWYPVMMLGMEAIQNWNISDVLVLLFFGCSVISLLQHSSMASGGNKIPTEADWNVGIFLLIFRRDVRALFPGQPTSLILVSVVLAPKIHRYPTLQYLSENCNSYQWRKAEVQSKQAVHLLTNFLWGTECQWHFYQNNKLVLISISTSIWKYLKTKPLDLSCTNQRIAMWILVWVSPWACFPGKACLLFWCCRSKEEREAAAGGASSSSLLIYQGDGNRARTSVAVFRCQV